jgi:hypothetical protein
MRPRSWGSAFVRYEISCESTGRVSDLVRSPDRKSGKNCRSASSAGGGNGHAEGPMRAERKWMGVARARAHGMTATLAQALWLQ